MVVSNGICSCKGDIMVENIWLHYQQYLMISFFVVSNRNYQFAGSLETNLTSRVSLGFDFEIDSMSMTGIYYVLTG